MPEVRTDFHMDVERITPEVAKYLLSQNIDRNRKVANKDIRAMVDVMKKGLWRFDGAPIRVSKTGRLMDGQHRLTAVVESNTTQEMVVIYGLEDDVFTVMDTGRSRTANDTLHIAGIKNSQLAAATTKLILNYERVVAFSQLKNPKPQYKLAATNQEILDFNETVDLTGYLEKGSKFYKQDNMTIYGKAEYAFYYWIFSHICKEDADEFLHKLSTGANVDVDNPIYNLRTLLGKWKREKISVSAVERLGLTMKAWNFFRNREKVSSKTMIYDFQREGLIEPK